MNHLKSFIIILIVFTLFSCETNNKATKEGLWWKKTVFYEIYMPSYKDSNGDGYGDFKGLTSKLDYIQHLGIKGIWLTPFLKSPKVDNGYDVADYYKIDSTYGTMDDFKLFLKEAHKRNIKVIMDLVVNHTSTESKWFQEARKSKDNPYRNYYIWRDKPNNWESFFGGSAWKLDSITHQYYYHKFDVKMADLNWQNPKVVEEIQKVERFWLGLGIDGFRMDVINFLTTNGITKDNPIKDGKQIHLYDRDQPNIKDAIRAIKSTVNDYKNKFVVGEIGSDDITVLKKYQANDLLDVVFNFNFGSIKAFSSQRIFDELKSMEANMPDYPTLFFGSHDMPRLMNRLANENPQKAETLAALMLTAKGVPFVYYGDEIGMQNIEGDSIKEIKDIQAIIHYKLALQEGKSVIESLKIANEFNRDKSRSPMQWNNSTYAGFSTHKPWIKVNPDYRTLNVKALENKPYSLLNNYRKLIKFRNSEPILQYGNYTKISLSNDVISFSRVYNKNEIRCFFNFSKINVEISLNKNEKVLFGKSNLKPNHYLIMKSNS